MSFDKTLTTSGLLFHYSLRPQTFHEQMSKSEHQYIFIGNKNIKSNNEWPKVKTRD